MTFDEVDASVPSQVRNTELHVCVLQKNASNQRLLDLFAPKLIALERGKPSRRPRSPSSNHNVKERHKGRIFIPLSMEHRPQEVPAERRGRGLYEGAPPKSNPKKQIFSGPVGS